ncbi:ABC transporter permease [Spirilliplanes yamanashiensis]|uniref:ABC transporter permease n=1 Tax=Spirilliplanes yamanashiensis TaxID=42233 RepID=A0A8J3YDB0_9ACTN|nr:ABC transporter permease [Spirilliplanes yamanashiensis]MDP9816113.1 spermidine/putrescine transport system permease protein [Spirilliplanes yamanashiensis]GIJ05635.1 ABC transporter permease [Spirilliplanes yamanashiensis]
MRGSRVVAGLVLAYLLLPVAVVVGLSFNAPSNRLSYDFDRFTLANWADPCGPAGLCASVLRSAQIGLLATVLATVLGTLLAFGLTRHRFRGRGPLNALVFLPMATPEVVLGSSLLALFTAGAVPLGFWTVVIAHVMFCVSFVVVVVKARLAGMDPRLEEAAADLYASPWHTFRTVTLPLAMPGIVAGALLAFSLSFDDFIVSNFNAGTMTTFPMFVWGSAQRGIPPQVNVVGTAMFAVAVLAVVITTFRRRAR